MYSPMALSPSPGVEVGSDAGIRRVPALGFRSEIREPLTLFEPGKIESIPLFAGSHRTVNAAYPPGQGPRRSQGALWQSGLESSMTRGVWKVYELYRTF